jgi:catechol 2,3-dioxygenase-like lactoylglutathione lyase family enzyme
MAVTIRSIRWLGVSTEELDAAADFFRHALGMRVLFEEDSTTELETEDGDRVQLFAPGHSYFTRASTVLPLFEVDDAQAAQVELKGQGVRVGELERDSAWEWFDVHSPDGKVYELGSRMVSS